MVQQWLAQPMALSLLEAYLGQNGCESRSEWQRRTAAMGELSRGCWFVAV
jgi:hypothetical protein